MAKSASKKNSQTSKGPAWKTNWPKNGDLRAWFRCCLEKCDAIKDIGDATEWVNLPIGGLAEVGHTAEALRYVDQWLKRIPPKETVEYVSMAELGAKICLEMGDLKRMEKYLALVAATEKFNKRKCDIGYSLNAVRNFRAFHGILDPAEAIDEEQRLEAQFNGAWRRSRELQKQGKLAEARAAAAEMEQFARQTKENWRRKHRFTAALVQHAALGDAGAVARTIKSLPKAERDEVLNYNTLQRIGMKTEAVAAAIRKAKSELAELEQMEDPNIHFPCGAISRALLFLIENGHKDEAQKLYSKVSRSAKTWPTTFGFSASAVLTMFAEVAAALEGPAAAKGLLAQAEQHAAGERHRGFRSGATAAAIEMQAQVSGVEEAIARAQKIRSGTERRSELAKLYAKAQRWSDLRAVCQHVTSPVEAAELSWWVKFELPGGEV